MTPEQQQKAIDTINNLLASGRRHEAEWNLQVLTAAQAGPAAVEAFRRGDRRGWTSMDAILAVSTWDEPSTWEKICG